jgi:hypothetical protein
VLSRALSAVKVREFSLPDAGLSLYNTGDPARVLTGCDGVHYRFGTSSGDLLRVLRCNFPASGFAAVNADRCQVRAIKSRTKDLNKLCYLGTR